MSATPIVRAALAADPTIAAAVGDRIFYSAAPQGAARSHIVIVGGPQRDEILLAGAARFPEMSCSVVIVADTHAECDRIGDAVSRLNDTAGTFAGHAAQFLPEDGGGADFVPDLKIHRRIVPLRVRYRP